MAFSAIPITSIENWNLIFVGHGGLGSNALSMYKGLASKVRNIEFVDTQFFDSPPRFSLRRIFHKFLPRIYGYIASTFLDRKITKMVKNFDAHIFFVFKGNYINKSTLGKISALKVHYHPDDSSNVVNRTNVFDKAEIKYDLHFTSKRHNVDEIYGRTKKIAYFIWYAYDPEWHFRKNPLNFNHLKYLFGFIGHWRPDRAGLIENLAKRYPRSFAIAGHNWNRVIGLAQQACLFPPAYGERFSDFVAGVPIQLGLLNSDNRDQHTARSFEIPACGGLLIAEDTSEHREMFGSGKNALFFTDMDDLEKKLAWVWSHPDEAMEIAENGFQFITSNQNTWSDRSLEMLSKIALHVSLDSSQI